MDKQQLTIDIIKDLLDIVKIQNNRIAALADRIEALEKQKQDREIVYKEITF